MGDETKPGVVDSIGSGKPEAHPTCWLNATEAGPLARLFKSTGWMLFIGWVEFAVALAVGEIDREADE